MDSNRPENHRGHVWFYHSEKRFKSMAVWLWMMICGACSGTPPEAPRTSGKPASAWAADEQRRIDDAIRYIEKLSCRQLTDPEISYSEATAYAFAKALLHRCEPPPKKMSSFERRDPQKMMERAADLFFRIIPEKTGQSRTKPAYPFLDDPNELALAKRLFTYFLNHEELAAREGTEYLEDWAPYAGIYEQLAYSCEGLRTLAPNSAVALALWNSLHKSIHCAREDAIMPLKAALKGPSTSRAAACKQLAEDSLSLETEMIEAVQTDYGEKEYGATGSVQFGPFVIPTGSVEISARYPGQDACKATLAKVHGVRVMSVLVDSPSVTVTVVYYGNPKAIVVFTAEEDGSPTRGYVASSVPHSVPTELSALVEPALPKKKTVDSLVAKPLNDRTARLDESGGFAKTTGPHQWALVMPRYPLPSKIVVVVIDEDGTIRKSGG